MVDVSRTFTVPRPPEEVVAYLSDFSNAVAWDPGTVRCDSVGTGPVQVGSTWRNVSKVLGRETELEAIPATQEIARERDFGERVERQCHRGRL